ncbi:hypothetical protein JHK87_039530 [Glycine soja]|nr:hypothetical protein JHK87_039530 [Glycine soja]
MPIPSPSSSSTQTFLTHTPIPPLSRTPSVPPPLKPTLSLTMATIHLLDNSKPQASFPSHRILLSDLGLFPFVTFIVKGKDTELDTPASSSCTSFFLSTSLVVKNSPLQSVLEENMGISKLFPVQVALWQETVGSGDFERDLCTNSPTGSGKTLAYALPIVQNLSTDTDGCLRALVVISTRDLALQVKRVFDALASPLGLRKYERDGSERW